MTSFIWAIVGGLIGGLLLEGIGFVRPKQKTNEDTNQ